VSPPGSRRLLRVLAIVLIAGGSLALLDAAVTVLWQEPFSALYAKLRQDHLKGALRRIERQTPTPLERRALATLADERTRIAYLARELDRHSANGSPLGRIVIPRIGASFVVVKGTDTEDLKSGPGVYSETALPGGGDTTAIAGHRTTYLAPFRHIDALRKGSAIVLDMPYARFTYRVVRKRVVAPSDVAAVVGDVGHPRLVLSACTPLFSAAKRLLVFAALTRTVPVGAARRVRGGGAVRPILTPISGRRPRPPSPAHSPTVFEALQAHRLAPIIQ
jgi:sortase A